MKKLSRWPSQLNSIWMNQFLGNPPKPACTKKEGLGRLYWRCFISIKTVQDSWTNPTNVPKWINLSVAYDLRYLISPRECVYSLPSKSRACDMSRTARHKKNDKRNASNHRSQRQFRWVECVAESLGVCWPFQLFLWGSIPPQQKLNQNSGWLQKNTSLHFWQSINIQ